MTANYTAKYPELPWSRPQAIANTPHRRTQNGERKTFRLGLP